MKNKLQVVNRRNIKEVLAFLFALVPCISDIQIIVNGRYLNVNNFLLLFIVLISTISVIRIGKIRISCEEKIFVSIWLLSLLAAIISYIRYTFSLPLGYWLHILIMVHIFTIYRKNMFDNEAFWRTIYTFSIFLMGILVYQEITRILTGDFIRFQSMAQTERVASLFTEPTHYVLLISFLILAMLYEIDELSIRKKYRILYSILMSLSVIISVSSSGLIYLTFIWGMLFIQSKEKKALYTVALIAAIIFLVFIFGQDWILRSFSHLTSMKVGQITSGSFRVFRGFEIYDQLSSFQKIFGIGAGMVKGIVLERGIITIYDGRENIGSDYVSAFSSILIEVGMVGMAIFAFFIILLLSKKNKNLRILGVYYLLYIISNEIIYSPALMLPLFFAFLYKDKLRGD